MHQAYLELAELLLLSSGQVTQRTAELNADTESAQDGGSTPSTGRSSIASKVCTTARSPPVEEKSSCCQ